MDKTTKTQKMCVTVPISLAEEIRNTVAKGKKSSFIVEALEFYLTYRRQKMALERGFGAWKTEDHPDLITPEDTIKYVNSLRGRG